MSKATMKKKIFLFCKFLATLWPVNKFYKSMEEFLSKQSHDFAQGQGRATLSNFSFTFTINSYFSEGTVHSYRNDEL